MDEFEYWLLGIAISFTLILIVIFCIIHSHVWTKNGYAGLNLKLEDHEVDKFISHVLSEGSFVALVLFCLLDPLLVYNLNYKYSIETKVLFGSTFIGSGAFTIIGQILKNIKAKDKHDNHTDKT